MLAILLVALVAAAQAQTIPFEYVVVFTNDATVETIKSHMNTVVESGSKVLFNYDFEGFRGYSVRTPHGSALTDSRVQFLMAPEVSFFEANQIYKTTAPARKPVNATADCNLQEEATWGLVRTAQRNLNIDGLYPYSPQADGLGVSAYIIDTGIYLENADFERRAIWGYDAVDDPSPETDLNGHGTHVAGTVMGKTWGLAKGATAIAVRVLGASGSGTTAGVIAGVQYVATSGKGKKALANMSLGGGFSAAMNNAVKAATSAGVAFIVAAGNNAGDACQVSPASEPTAITVMCSDNTDAFCYFSNYGTCADIIAPGMAVTSAWIGGPYSTNTISGTSMSAPHVAGVVAKLISASATPLTPDQIKAALASSATPGKISNVKIPASTPNSLLYDTCE